ncbi:hypothetical protein JCGZ_05661 [Jatropha curcas]|uniref:MBD domain-containing protein n=1 Tax=Jatropha curcas TaxID=180498 RepID=A0A067LIW5_JATCU|nr:hypothetical protein JCGZ_05661 [Jatropha curcas]
MGREVSLSSLLILSGKQNQNRESEIVGPISTTSTAVCSSAPPFELPDGWVVEQRRRPRNGRFDKCYIEPGTGKRFRSLTSVERYLTEKKAYEAPNALNPGDQLYLTDGKEYTAMPEALELGDHTLSNHPNPEKKHVSGDEVDTSIVDLGNPPAKIKWVLSPVGNIWRSFSEDTLVPEAVKHKWSETFIRSLNDRY